MGSCGYYAPGTSLRGIVSIYHDATKRGARRADVLALEQLLLAFVRNLSVKVRLIDRDAVERQVRRNAGLRRLACAGGGRDWCDRGGGWRRRGSYRRDPRRRGFAR